MNSPDYNKRWNIASVIIVRKIIVMAYRREEMKMKQIQIRYLASETTKICYGRKLQVIILFFFYNLKLWKIAFLFLKELQSITRVLYNMPEFMIRKIIKQSNISTYWGSMEMVMYSSSL